MADVPSTPDPPRPDSPSGSDVTQLLAQASGGDPGAWNQLLPRVYDELRQVAGARLRFEADGHTLNATALVHEAYVRLVGQSRTEWQGRAHFFAIASQAMRRILINHAQARRTLKRGGGAPHLPLDAAQDALDPAQAAELLALNEALEALERFNERGARVIEYRFFGGLSNEEIAEVMGLSEVTVRRAWRSARAWLRDALDPSVSLSWAPSPDPPDHDSHRGA
ncbi:MAG: sigma-70 family RNA polymerase sigma factor [Gemmatimonadota bacterium]